MKWYLVTKKIGGQPYLYRQRTFREGGKVRSQCQYLGPASDNAIAQARRDEEQADDIKFGNPFLNQKQAPSFAKQFSTPTSKSVSIPSMQKEYGSMCKRLETLGLQPELMPKITLVEGKKAGWKRSKTGYKVTLCSDEKGSGRNRFRRHYREALAHAYFDALQEQSPSQYEALRTKMDQSYFNTKLLVTLQILKSKVENPKQATRIWFAMQFLWSGSLPRKMEKAVGYKSTSSSKWHGRHTWRDEAVGLMADVMQRGYEPTLAKLEKDRAKARANAKRALTNYQKLGRLGGLTKKGRNKWKLYKKQEANFLVAHQQQSRLMLMSLMETR